MKIFLKNLRILVDEHIHYSILIGKVKVGSAKCNILGNREG